MIWRHASIQHPCPICNKTDWCTFGDKAMLCQRVESATLYKNGGYFHFYGEGSKDFIPEPRKEQAVPIPPIRAASLMESFRTNITNFRYKCLAEDLGVKYSSLINIGAAWCERKNAWAFPMHDGDGKVCGIRLRNDDGFKWAYPGSKSGIFIPQYPNGVGCINTKRVYIPEGPTDTAALLSIGLTAVGRPNCATGTKQLRAWLTSMYVREVVIVADNDEMKRLGPREGRPGIEGAQRLQRELGMKSVIFIPFSPCKDARELVRRMPGLARQMIESDVNNKVWRKK